MTQPITISFLFHVEKNTRNKILLLSLHVRQQDSAHAEESVGVDVDGGTKRNVLRDFRGIFTAVYHKCMQFP